MIPRTDLEGKNSLTFSLAFQARRQSCPYFIAKKFKHLPNRRKAQNYAVQGIGALQKEDLWRLNVISNRLATVL